MPKSNNFRPAAKSSPPTPGTSPAFSPPTTPGKRPSTPGKAAIGEYARFQGKLAESPESLAGCLQFDLDLDRAAERLGNYAFLKTAEDVGESKYQRMHGRFMAVASRAAQAASFIRPEILAIPAAKMKSFLDCARAGPLQAPPASGCSATSRTRWARRKRTCWPCRRKWPRRPTRSSASSTTPT